MISDLLFLGVVSKLFQRNCVTIEIQVYIYSAEKHQWGTHPILLEHADAFDAEIFSYRTAIFISTSSTLEGFDEGGLAIVRPGKKYCQYCSCCFYVSYTCHVTACASFSKTTLTVVHENRTREGKPNVGSMEDLIHACVLGSKSSESA